MKRMVLIASRSIENEILNSLEENISEFNYNIFPQEHSKGKTKHCIDTVSSYEMVFFIVCYLDDENAIKARKLIYTVKDHFPNEAVKLYFIDANKDSKSY